MNSKLFDLKNNKEEKQIHCFSKQIEKIHNALPTDLHRYLDRKALMECMKWILARKKYVWTAHVIFEQAKYLLDAAAGYLAIYHQTTGEVEIIISDTGGYDHKPEYGEDIQLRGIKKRVLETCTSILINDFISSEHSKYLPEGHIQIDNILCAPMIVDGKGRGILTMANKNGGFSHTDLQIIELFAELAAIALKNSQAWYHLAQHEMKTAEAIPDYFVI